MIEVRVPPESELVIKDTRSLCRKVEGLPKESVHTKKLGLRNIKTNIALLLKKRRELLQREGYGENDCINLTTVERLPQLQKNYVVIKIQGVIAPIRLAEKTVISDYFDAVLYSINKYGNHQQVEHANPFDVELYRLIITYKTLRADFIRDNPTLSLKYKVNDTITIHLFQGIYRIIAIDGARVTISCKKWKENGRKPMKISVSDIKGYAYESQL